MSTAKVLLRTARERPVNQVVTAASLLEGGGFPVRRPFPTAGLPLVDPFLLLDHMGPVNWPPGEAVGAPDHPHRGFETVTYLLAGRMQHKDSGGHQGVLGPGDVQWMTAGAGVIHSEMPHPDIVKHGGIIHGFQLWVNLPAAQKMIAPRYQDIPSARIPESGSPDERVNVRVIAGDALGKSALIDTIIPITFLHFTLRPGAHHEQLVNAGHNGFVYVFSGEMLAGTQKTTVHEGQAAIFGDGDNVRLAVAEEADQNAELLLLAAPPLNEPVARYGPFVMNTHKQIEQALRDYRDGLLGA